MPHAFTAFIVQFWRGGKRQSEIGPISLDAAREIARVHIAFRDVSVRLMAEGEDYMEVYYSDGSIRRGTFAETTLVHVHY